MRTGGFVPVERGKTSDELFEDSSAMLVILKLVEAGTSWSEQNNVSGLGGCGSLPHCGFNCARGNDLRSLDLRLDLVRRCSNRINAFHPLAKQIVQHRIVAALILAPENQMDVGSE